MRKILEARVKDFDKLADDSHVRAAALGLLRITMQHACVCLGEWIADTLRSDPSKLKSFTGVDLRDFVSPADGDLVSLLAELLVAVENLGWRSAGRRYWGQFELSDELKQLIKKPKANVETIVLAFIHERNDGAEGHGLAGGYYREIDKAVIGALIDRATPFLPVATKSSDMLSFPSLGDRPAREIKTLRLFDGDPVCYRRLRSSSAGRVLVDAQIQRSLREKEDVSYEVPNALLELPVRTAPDYQIFEPTWSQSWKPFVFLPDRLATAQEFTGRVKELCSLEEWADDSDSRRCMVYGDGGQGKTTLVIEFVHRLLEGSANVVWRPEIITFYTAKKTRWGIDGLEHISAQDVGVADVAVEIARMHSTKPLDRSWFDRNPRDVIQKLAGLQAEMGLARDDHLIILDNTETMAQSEDDVINLASQINELSRRVGRVILTSRRREQIEAKPIQTENWTEEEGSDFLRKRGRTLNCSNILDAGVSTLKGYSRKLGNKPIALEVFAQAASFPGVSLEHSFQRVQQMQRQDLGHFLYDDAWSRLAPEVRHVLLLMSRLGDIVDQYMIQLCCRQTNVSVASASEAIEESKGIGTISRIQGTLQVAFSPEFFNYCSERSELINGVVHPTDSEIEWVRRRYSEFIVRTSAQVRDRSTRAFRVPSARAAWQSFADGEFDDAFDHYEDAITEDSENGFLYDRYAYALFTRKKYALALGKSEKATQLLPEEPEAWFTRGMVEGRMGVLSKAIEHLTLAEKYGKPSHLCDLQKAYAYVNAEDRDVEQAERFLKKALKNVPKDRFFNRFVSEAEAFKRRWLYI